MGEDALFFFPFLLFLLLFVLSSSSSRPSPAAVPKGGVERGEAGDIKGEEGRVEAPWEGSSRVRGRKEKKGCLSDEDEMLTGERISFFSFLFFFFR